MQWDTFRSAISDKTAKERKLIQKAFELGEKAHRGQIRKSGDPYFTHPIAVAHILIGMGADTDTIIAALLHDTVEDTSLSLEDIEKEFGKDITALIDGVTKLDGETVASYPSLDEKIETLRKMFTLMQKDVRIMVIKLVDRLHNMQTIGFRELDKQKQVAKETMDVYVKIAERLCMQDVRDEMEALCLAVLEPKTMQSLTKLREKNHEQSLTILQEIKKDLEKKKKAIAPIVSIVPEKRRWEQLRMRMHLGESVATGRSTITLAFVCKNIEACYLVLGSLHQLWQREVLSFQDFINHPELNGYEGLHTTIIIPGGKRIRCKIRTEEMQRYAHFGITTKCFDSKSKGLPEYLPWAQRISPLTTDTKGRSSDFWESLQSDILGETIIIHGPDDSAMQVPRNATALDSAFYFIHEKALATVAIRINGVDVSFDTKLRNADSIEITLALRETCTREWLQSVHTGLSVAIIRTALSKQSTENKLAIGKSVLQEIFTDKRKGFIEEFNKEMLCKRLQSAGFSSLEDAYVAIADGRVEPHDVFTAIFSSQGLPKQPDNQPKITINYAVDSNLGDGVDKLNHIHQAFERHLDTIFYRRRSGHKIFITLHAHMDNQTANQMGQSLKNAGAESVSIRKIPSQRHLLIIALLIGLWGLDPILSKFFMQEGLHALTFSFVRAWSVLLFSVILVLSLKRKDALLVRIPLRHPSLWIAGIAVFFVNIFTYEFLMEGSPVLYNTILRANAVILALPLLTNTRYFRTVLAAIILTVIGLLIAFAGPFGIRDLLYSIGILAAFSTYTTATIAFQSVAKIHARYIQLFAYTSLIAAVASLSLVAFDLIQWPTNTNILWLASAYSMFIVGLPYFIFHAFTDNFGYATLSPWINATILVTLIAQPFILNDTLHYLYLIPAALFLTGGSLLASRARYRSA